ncbi:YcnI family protein [Microtetraspora sp. NBRC 16547]|uniref:YcnI family copper-binding membrane protein n=1 Tax=Microtetraspora sp. NBRC 16547 TaxID=3030993 RepID=UPI0024A54E62|nr:YcnI family protein [Microtetraspora sp. NBRC 16547]GLX02486.1 membrane protein [Microtetraspora sp. NBRC 16547]
MTLTTAARRTAAVTAGALAVTLGLAVPALAHVTVNPGTAVKGSWSKLAFRVPNERDNASTTKIEVEFPTDNPLPFVSVRPVPGWDVKVIEGKLPAPVVSDSGDTITESVLKITWTGGKIGPGQFQEFEASVGPLPTKVDELTFPTTQTYSNDEVVKWADPAKPDGSEPDHPAPTLKLVAADDDTAGGHGATASSAAPSVAASNAEAASSDTGGSSSDGTARLIGAIGIVVGLAGTAVGVAGLRRRSQ